MTIALEDASTKYIIWDFEPSPCNAHEQCREPLWGCWYQSTRASAYRINFAAKTALPQLITSSGRNSLDTHCHWGEPGLHRDVGKLNMNISVVLATTPTISLGLNVEVHHCHTCTLPPTPYAPSLLALPPSHHGRQDIPSCSPYAPPTLAQLFGTVLYSPMLFAYRPL